MRGGEVKREKGRGEGRGGSSKFLTCMAVRSVYLLQVAVVRMLRTEGRGRGRGWRRASGSK